jgi:hypothetical protein
MLATVPRLSRGAANAVVIAARSYQQALWICESSPETAWIFFVSSVEAAASYWDPQAVDPLDSVLQWDPKLHKLLLQQGEPHARKVAEHLSGMIGAGRKFREFLLNFGPKPPDKRPSFATLDWEQQALGKAYSRVYKYRSDALHAGTPFPQPLCEAPLVTGSERAYAETPMAAGYKGMGATWNKKDLPMLLHTFEYIARNSLLSWWRSQIESSEKPDGTTFIGNDSARGTASPHVNNDSLTPPS